MVLGCLGVTGDTDWQFIPVNGDPKLIIRALAKLIDIKRPMGDEILESDEDELQLPPLKELLECKQKKLVQLAQTVGASDIEIKTAKAASEGAHPFSLYAMFRRFTNHQPPLTEQGFWKVLTTTCTVTTKDRYCLRSTAST